MNGKGLFKLSTAACIVVRVDGRLMRVNEFFSTSISGPENSVNGTSAAEIEQSICKRPRCCPQAASDAQLTQNKSHFETNVPQNARNSSPESLYCLRELQAQMRQAAPRVPAVRGQGCRLRLSRA